MFQIDPHSARTDLYGIGKGEAQVIDLSPTMERAAEERKQSFANKQSIEKRKDSREDDLYNRIGDLDKASIYAGHRPEFAAKQKELSDFTVKNIQKLREGDSEAIMQFQDLYSSIRTNAELSKNFREQKERIGLELLKDPAAYRDESIDYLTNTGRDENGDISYEIDPSKIRKNVDLMGDFDKTVRPLIDKVAQGSSYSYTDAQGNEHSVDHNSFDENQATVLLQDRLKHPEVAEQAAYSFNKLPPEEKAKYTDYNDYYIKSLLPYATVNKNKTVDKKSPDKKEYTYENGAWSNDDYAWSYNKGKVVGEPKPGFRKGDEYEEISLSNRKTDADNKPVALTKGNGETVYGIPKGVIKKKGWASWMVAIEEVDKKTGRPKTDKKGDVNVTYEPVRNNKSKLQGEYGFDIDTAIKEVDKKTASDKPATSSGSSSVKKIKTGDVIDGYKFKGGNPNDQKNWEEVK
jgi:hypothetical protein